MQLSPTELNDLRTRVLAGERLTVEQYSIIVASLRGARVTAALTASTSKKKGTRKPPQPISELLSDIDSFIAKKNAEPTKP